MIPHSIRCSELCHLKLSDIDSERMVIHIHKGKGGRDRDVLLSPKLLETLREYPTRPRRLFRRLLREQFATSSYRRILPKWRARTRMH